MGEVTEKEYHAACPALGLCSAACPLKVTVQGGRITHVSNQPGQPCCIMGHAARADVYNPARLKYPMKRTGERGEGSFQRITWDEALDSYAGKIREIGDRYGYETILWYAGRGLSGLAREAAKVRLPNLLGGMLTPWGSLCILNKKVAARSVFGTENCESDVETIKDSRLAIFWGYGFADSNRRGGFAGRGMRILMEARQAGTRIVVIDPFLSQTASKADQWIPIRPGTDGAMALAMANVIIERGLENHDFVTRHTLGFDRFVEHVQGCTPEWAEAITGVPAETIRGLAIEFATQQPAALFPGDGPSRVGRDPSQWVRACGALSAITGSLGKPGTNACSGTAYPKGITSGTLTASERKKTSRQVNECQVADVILTGKALQPSGKVVDCPIHMIIQHGGSLVSQPGDSNKTSRALKSPSIEFIVVADLYMTPTARFADLLLPVASGFERYDAGFYKDSDHAIVFSEQCIEPVGECRTDISIWAAVADRLGVGEEFHSDWTELDWMRETLKATAKKTPSLAGVTLERLQQEKVLFVGPEPFIPFQTQVKEGKSFPTKSGKIEIYSEELAAKGLPPLPTYLDDFENARHPLATRYPLSICTPHLASWLHSRSNNPWLSELYTPEVFINSADSASRGIEDGDQVVVYNDRGATRRTARVGQRVALGVVALPQGPWFDPGPDGVDRGGSVNVLTVDDIDRMAGAGTYNSSLVEVKKA